MWKLTVNLYYCDCKQFEISFMFRYRYHSGKYTCMLLFQIQPNCISTELYISFKCGFDTGTDNFGRVFTLLSLTQDECFNGQVLVNSQLGRWCGVRTQPPHWITVIVDTSKWTNPARWNWTPLTACCQSGCSCVKTFTVSTMCLKPTPPLNFSDKTFIYSSCIVCHLTLFI